MKTAIHHEATLGAGDGMDIVHNITTARESSSQGTTSLRTAISAPLSLKARMAMCSIVITNGKSIRDMQIAKSVRSRWKRN